MHGLSAIVQGLLREREQSLDRGCLFRRRNISKWSSLVDSVVSSINQTCGTRDNCGGHVVIQSGVDLIANLYDLVATEPYME